MVGDSAQPVAETPVCFLQRDYVGVDFTQHLQNALRIAAAISADAFADIVGCDLNGWHGQSAGPK